MLKGRNGKEKRERKKEERREKGEEEEEERRERRKEVSDKLSGGKQESVNKVRQLSALSSLLGMKRDPGSRLNFLLSSWGRCLSCQHPRWNPTLYG